VTEAQVHKSSLCPDCKKKKAELAEIAFLRQKKILMERALLREKLEEQIYSRVSKCIEVLLKKPDTHYNWRILKPDFSLIYSNVIKLIWMQYSSKWNLAPCCYEAMRLACWSSNLSLLDLYKLKVFFMMSWNCFGCILISSPQFFWWTVQNKKANNRMM